MKMIEAMDIAIKIRDNDAEESWTEFIACMSKVIRLTIPGKMKISKMIL